MASRVHFILTILAAVLASAWHAPCCCQNAWAAREGARLLAGAPEQDHCGCCRQKAEQPRDRGCCPPGSKECKQIMGKAAVVKAGVQVAPAGHEWVLAMRPEFRPVGFGWTLAAPVGIERPPQRVCTLLGLKCALTT